MAVGSLTSDIAVSTPTTTPQHAAVIKIKAERWVRRGLGRLSEDSWFVMAGTVVNLAASVPGL